MKRSKAVYILIILQLFICFTGCKKFVENVDAPISRIPSDKVFASDATATAAVLGIYANMFELNSFASGSYRSITALCGLSADELSNLPSSVDNPIARAIEQNNIINTNEYVLGLWRSLYQSIYQANAVLEGLAASLRVSDTLKSQLRGEALLVRAFCHFYLVNLFGKVPLVVSTDYHINGQIRRSETDLVYEQVIADLLQAKSLLSDEYPRLNSSAVIERIRPNRYAAIALLARVYLYRQHWDMAEAEATTIINKPSVYNLTDSLNDAFLKQSSEAIWQLGPTIEKLNTNEGFYFAGNFSQFNVLKNSFPPGFEFSDKRKNNWVGISGSLYYPHKYKQVVFPADNVTEYSMLLRLAEQFLIRAEARARLNNLTGVNSASEDLNRIRKRAGLANTNAVSQADILLAIEQERKVELFTEWGHRWFDLKRWEKAIAVLGPQKPGFTKNDLLYPVPQQEINKNRNLLPQNESY